MTGISSIDQKTMHLESKKDEEDKSKQTLLQIHSVKELFQNQVAEYLSLTDFNNLKKSCKTFYNILNTEVVTSKKISQKIFNLLKLPYSTEVIAQIAKFLFSVDYRLAIGYIWDFKQEKYKELAWNYRIHAKDKTTYVIYTKLKEKNEELIKKGLKDQILADCLEKMENLQNQLGIHDLFMIRRNEYCEKTLKELDEIENFENGIEYCTKADEKKISCKLYKISRIDLISYFLQKSSEKVQFKQSLKDFADAKKILEKYISKFTDPAEQNAFVLLIFIKFLELQPNDAMIKKEVLKILGNKKEELINCWQENLQAMPINLHKRKNID